MEKAYLSFVNDSEHGGLEFVDGANKHLFVGPISKVNILVGANNSRKSRFMRMLWASDENPMVGKEVKDAFHKGKEAFDNTIGLSSGNELINAQTAAINIPNRHAWFDEVFDHYKYDEEDRKQTLFIDTLSNKDTRDGVRLILDQETLLSMKQKLTELFSKVANKHQVGLDKYRALSELFELLYKNANKHNGKIIGSPPDQFNFKLMSQMRDDFLEIHESFEVLLSEKTTAGVIPKMFIPVLRGALPIADIDTWKTQYRDSTYKLYFGKEDENGKVSSWSISPDKPIHTGDELYSQILTDRNSNLERREKFQQFQTFLSEHFFDGHRIEIVAKPKDEDQTIMVYIDGEKERNLQDLGDGIQHLLILLYPIFMAEDGTWVFIDEPELSLHPGFQNLFLDTLLTNADLKAKNLRYFMTTHSNHFLSHALRSPDEVSVFSFSQYNKDQSIIRCVHGGDTSVLDQLGVENASVYMANCSIWVEGVSDRRYLQAFLKAYCAQKDDNGNALFPEFKEGLDYTFFEYAGTNLTHYLFEPDADDPDLIDSFKNANRIFLLADEDAGKDEKHNKLRSLKSDNFEYHTTGAREVENMLPPFVYQDFIASYPSQENLTFSATHSDYTGEYMGEFLRNHIGVEALKYGEKTLTTKYKNDLSKLVQDKSYTWDQLSKSGDIVRVTKAVYDFIKRHNTSRN